MPVSLSAEAYQSLIAEVREGGVRQEQPPRASVIMATFNRPALLTDAIRAIAVQECAVPFELIVVDDGSTPAAWETLCELVDGSELPMTAIRLRHNMGRSVARNVALAYASGEIVAITDDDCLPTTRWLAEGLREFGDARVGIVQGSTGPHPEQRQTFFNHFIEIRRLDGTFSTCNVFYRKSALESVGGFNPAMNWWEDLDLGWRVRRSGWRAAYIERAEVYHQVLTLTPLQWLRWPTHFSDMPAKVSRYPEYRDYLFLGLWVNWFHALFDLAVLSIPLGLRVHRGFLLLSLPYVVAFPFRHGLRGRWPVAKAALHLAWDLVSFGTLVVSSVRHRAPVF